MLNQGGAVFIDNRWKVHRSGREGRHVGLEIERRTACRRIAAAPSGRELNDHPRTMLLDTLLHLGEALGVGGWSFVVVSNVNMRKRCASLEGLVRRLDLLGRRDRHRGIVFLARNGTGDCDSNNNRGHLSTPW